MSYSVRTEADVDGTGASANAQAILLAVELRTRLTGWIATRGTCEGVNIIADTGEKEVCVML